MGTSADGRPSASSSSAVVSQSTVALCAATRSSASFSTAPQPGAVGEHPQVAGAVEELVLQREVADERLVDRLGLLDGGLHERQQPAERGQYHVGHGVERVELLGDAAAAAHRVRRVVPQLAADGVGAGLGDADAGDLRLGSGELLECTQLGDDRVDGRSVDGGCGGCGGVRHGTGVPTAGSAARAP